MRKTLLAGALAALTLAAAGGVAVAQQSPDRALRADVDVPYSCRNGTCRTCLSRVLSGEIGHDPDYADELLIEEHEDAAGYRLLCSSLAYSDSVVDIG